MKSRTVLLIIILMGLIVTPSWAKNVYVFEGEANLIDKQIDIKFDFEEKGSIQVVTKLADKQNVRISLILEKLILPRFSISSQIDTSLELNQTDGQKSSIKGIISSKYTLINYKPTDELAGRFEIKDGKFFISSFRLGNIKAKGFVDLEAPHDLNLSFNLKGVMLDDFINFWTSKKKYKAIGTVSGKIEATGSIARLDLKGSLESYYGQVGKLAFDGIYLHIGGTYPDMIIEYSSLTKTDGLSFTFEGPINLADTANFKKQIKSLKLSAIVSNSEEEIEWTIKRDKDERALITELKILRKKDQSRIGHIFDNKDSDMLGIARSHKF